MGGPAARRAAVAAAVIGLGGGGRQMATPAIAPDGTYRIDWVTPNRLDRLLHAGMAAPGRIELHNNLDGRLVARSGVLDLDLGGNGQPAWLMQDMGLISVGPGAQFLHIPPLAPDGSPLPIQKNYDGASASPPINHTTCIR